MSSRRPLIDVLEPLTPAQSIKVVGAVQVRMGSSRLPGKALIDLAGRPLLAVLIDRVRQSRRIDQVVIATTRAPEDDALEQFGAHHNVPVYRGETDDIIARLEGACRLLNGDIVVRLWGDSPLVDAKVLDEVIRRVIERRLDYVATFYPRRTFPAGFDADAFRHEALVRLRRSRPDPFIQQFPFEHIVESGEFRWGQVMHGEDLSHLHLTVDYAADLALVERIYRELQRSRGLDFSLDDVLDELQRHPDLLEEAGGLERNIEYQALRQTRHQDPGADH